MIFTNVTTVIMKVLFMLLEISFPLWLTYIYAWLLFFQLLFIVITILQACLVKIWIKLVLKAVRSIDDQFLVRNLVITNIFISSFTSLLRLNAGHGKKYAFEIMDQFSWYQAWGRQDPQITIRYVLSK